MQLKTLPSSLGEYSPPRQVNVVYSVMCMYSVVYWKTYQIYRHFKLISRSSTTIRSLMSFTVKKRKHWAHRNRLSKESTWWINDLYIYILNSWCVLLLLMKMPYCRCLLNNNNQQSGLPPSATNWVWQCTEGEGDEGPLALSSSRMPVFQCHPIRELLGNAFAHPVELGDECKCSEIKVSPWQWCSTCFSPFMSEWWWR